MRVVWNHFFKKWIQSLSSILEECNFMFQQDGLKMSCLSSCQTSCVECWVPATSFGVYDIQEPMTLGISLPVLQSLLRLKQKDQQVTWEWDNDQTCTMKFVQDNRTHVSFGISLMYVEVDAMEIPNDIVYDAIVDVPADKTKYWYQALQQLKGPCKFDVRDDGFHILSSSDYTSIHLYNHTLQTNIQQTFNTTIGYKAFENAYQCSLVGKHMQIRMKQQYPIAFFVPLDEHAHMTLYVAPIMEDE